MFNNIRINWKYRDSYTEFVVSCLNDLYKWTKSPFIAIYYGIRNLIRYFRIIWNDRDWDYCYIYQLLNKKFTYMATLHENDGHLVRSSRTAKELRIAAYLAKRLADGNYGLTEDGNLDKSNFGWVQLPKKLDLKARDAVRWSFRVNRQENEDKKMLFNLLNRKINTFWD